MGSSWQVSGNASELNLNHLLTGELYLQALGSEALLASQTTTGV